MRSSDAFMKRLNPDMCVVTAVADGERSGCLVGFWTQCSIDPPRLTVWISKTNHTHRVALRAERLTVHLLTPEQHGLAAMFGGRTGDDTDKFADVEWHEGPGGSAVLTAAAAWTVGVVQERFDTGDHVAHVLAPEQSGEHPGTGGALLRLEDVLDIEPGHPA
ncbi:flavin reductase family protein [Streptomyces sp. UH6]|uniref:flavin reductase family protein n=1 Tax=Streptomyces sp. UH6 TaxID=2748379 RepID=UPI0015D47E46|nr:flavin reductase family protein [Streptomyces sp. UH6]NYV76068.1 flavin reductase [Streptomyces sp. UH6]